ncbi:uncharacterized protein LOC121400432 [Xenopus laevis]|uniref:Uncharacterized protein LOC121400432 n=1 Tax=Xenopus laevis TaxID=8355 RepID=A0A8J1MCL7_XENLA|nr:uncharacterized protein LOC121400432 [Xenopus laevis]
MCLFVCPQLTVLPLQTMVNHVKLSGTWILFSWNSAKPRSRLVCAVSPPVLATSVIARVEVTVGQEEELGGKWPFAGTAKSISALRRWTYPLQWVCGCLGIVVSCVPMLGVGVCVGDVGVAPFSSGTTATNTLPLHSSRLFCFHQFPEISRTFMSAPPLILMPHPYISSTPLSLPAPHHPNSHFLHPNIISPPSQISSPPHPPQAEALLCPIPCPLGTYPAVAGWESPQYSLFSARGHPHTYFSRTETGIGRNPNEKGCERL